MTDSRISIIVPTLNEAGQIGSMLSKLQPLRKRGHEVIVVDGGSGDKTTSEAKPFADRVLDAPRGRASQLAFGAKASGHPVLWFVHADTWIPKNADHLIIEALRNAVWGRFDVRLSGRDCHPGLSIVERFMNGRSRLTGIATGDQGIFVTRTAFNAIGGIPSLPLMEDVELSRRLKVLGRPACIREPLTTSSRRWEQHGVFRTVAFMWLLRGAYGIGIPPNILARFYH
jgi:rSAM/selenodomain-associated transferase 2